MKKIIPRFKSLSALFLCFAIIFTNGLGNINYVHAAVEPKAGVRQLVFGQEYATVGEPLTASVENDTSGHTYTYTWTVGNRVVENNTTNSYTPTKADLEKFIKVRASSNMDTTAFEIQLYFSELPVVYVNTENNVAVTSKVNYINANLKIQGNSEYNSTTTTLYNGLTEIKGRGNNTWTLAKKPYKLKLDKKTQLLGMSNSKHFVLLADYNDRSLMRNLVTQSFAGGQGSNFTVKMTSVVVVLNGSYDGLYQLGEQIRIDSQRVDVYDWETAGEDIAGVICKAEGIKGDDKKALETAMVMDLTWATTKRVTFNGKTYEFSSYANMPAIPDISDPANTGGFLAEIDMYYDEISKFRSSFNQPIQFSSPEYLKTNETMFTNTKNFINAFENAIQKKDFYTTDLGKQTHYSELFDVDSLVEYLFVNELSMNPDGMKNSTYFYKDVGKPAIMGPVWDYDWSFGLSWYSNNMTYSNWFVKEYTDSHQGNNYYKYLLQDPYFLVRYYEHYKKIRPTVIENMIKENGSLDVLTEKISIAGVANYARWFGSSTADIKYAEEAAKVKAYAKNRVSWLDTQFASLDKMIDSLDTYTRSTDLRISDIDTDRTDGKTKITALVTDPKVKTAVIQVNGIKAGEATVENSYATFLLPDSYLEEEKGVSNVIQIRGLNAAGAYVSQFAYPKSNYAIFQKDISSKVEEVIVSPVSKTIEVGSEFNLTASIMPKNTTDYNLTYTSDQPTIATVTEDGIVKGVKEGEATIHVSAGGKEATCVVTVTAKKIVVNVPGKVTSFFTSSTTYNSISLKWSPVKNAAGYTIYLGNDPICSLTGRTASYKVSVQKGNKKLSPATAYKFKIVAYNLDNGKKVYGQSTDLATYTRPIKPKISKLSTPASRIRIQWKRSSGIKQYQIVMSKNKSKGYKQLIKTTKTSYYVPSKKLKSGQKYYFKIRSYKKINGKIVYSEYSTVKFIRAK